MTKIGRRYELWYGGREGTSILQFENQFENRELHLLIKT